MQRLIMICFITIIMSQICLRAVAIRGNYFIKKSKGRTEIYTENYSFNHFYQPTERISISDSLRYTKTKRGTNETQVITPTGTFSIHNDIFNLNFSGTLSETLNTKKPDLFSSTYNINLSSYYKKIVNINLNYTNSNIHDDLNPKKLNSETHQYGISLKRSFFKYFSISYDFRKNETENKVNKLKNKNYSENIIFNLNGVSFNFSKFFASFSANYNYKKDKMKADVSEKGIAEFPVAVEIQTSPVLTSSEYLNDNQTIIIKIPNSGIDIVYFYKDGLYLDTLDIDVKWNVYWSKTGEPDTYKVISTDAVFPYKVRSPYNKEGYLKFEILSFPENKIELNNPAIQCFIIKNSTKGYATMKSYSRDFNFNINSGYNFNEKISTIYNFTYTLNNPSPGLQKETISQSLSAGMNMNRYINVTTTLSRDEQKTQSSPSTINYSFSFSNNSEILKTLSSNFTYGYSINYVSSKKINASHNLNLSFNAQIYPDLSVKWDNSFTINKSFSPTSESKTYSSSINITARFTPSITLTSIYKYTRNISPVKSKDQNLTNNLSWRISEIMFINIGENIVIPDKGKKNYNHSFSLWIAPTKKIQYNLSYTTIRGKTKSDSISNFLSWKISNKLSTKVTFNKKIVKGDHTWDAMLGLSFAF